VVNPRNPYKNTSPAVGLFLAGLLVAVSGSAAGFLLLRFTEPWQGNDRPAQVFAGTAIVTGIFWIAALAKR
jgi:hypothetical protein